MATTIKAQVAPVSIGLATIDGLMDAEGNFYVGVPQVAAQFQFDSNQASRSIKSMLGSSFQFDKAKTELNPKAVNVMRIRDFELLLAKLDRGGNILVQQFRDDMVGLSLHQLFCDAFGLKFEQEERQAWLVVRQESKALFWELANAVQRWMGTRECSAPAFTYYKNTFDAVNLGLFGLQSNKIKESLGLESSSALCRDHYGVRALTNIATTQGLASRMMAKNQALRPVDAVKGAINVNLIDVQDFRI